MRWTATYTDGTVINEDDVPSTENIDRDQLKEFRLFDGDRLVFVGVFDQYRKLIFRRRTYMVPSGVTGIVYLVGWHQNVNGVSVKSICYVYEDGHVEFDDSRNDLELVPCEQFEEMV